MMHRVALALVFLALPLFGGEAEGKGESPRPPRPGMVIKFVLDHAQELVLTDDQKAKIEALVKEHAGKRPEGRPEGKPEGRPEGKPEGKDGRHGKGPLADILTEEQSAKLKEMLKAGRPDRKEEEKP